MVYDLLHGLGSYKMAGLRRLHPRNVVKIKFIALMVAIFVICMMRGNSSRWRRGQAEASQKT